MSAALELRGVRHRFAGVDVLGPLDLQVAPGEVVCVVGPSGCGKSTLLRCAAGLLVPTAGQVQVAGTALAGPPAELGVVFQDYGRSLLPWLRVLGNVELPLLSDSALLRPQRRTRAEKALAAVGLDALVVGRRFPRELSGGMAQRVALARALVVSPRLLLLDEPFASVDAQAREELEDLVLDARERTGAAVLVVTHDVDESVYLADRVLVLTAGPGRVGAQVSVDLPQPREQVATRADPRFAALRTRVAQALRAGR